MPDQLELGNWWIQRKLIEIGDKAAIPVSDIQWFPEKDPETQRWRLEFKTPKGTQSMNFEQLAIDHCVRDSAMQWFVEARIMALLAII
jgi:hypothetical protein